MPSFDVEFEVFCGTCGAGLCSQSDTRTSRNRGALQVTVEACKNCVESARDKGYSEGYDKGYNDKENEIEIDG